MPNQNQPEIEIEDDIKTPGLGQPGRRPETEGEEGTTETSSGLEDGDEALEEEDDELGDEADDDEEDDEPREV